MASTEYLGGCACGRIRYRVAGGASAGAYCHCESCRRASGAPFIAWITFPAGGFRLLKGELGIFRSSVKVRRGFCTACGTALTYWHEARDAEIDLTTASLDEPEHFPPRAHIWVADKLRWVKIADGLPQFEGWRSEG